MYVTIMHIMINFRMITKSEIGNNNKIENTNKNGNEDKDNPQTSRTLADLLSSTSNESKFFDFRKRLYIFYKTSVWPFYLDRKRRKREETQLIRSWTKFLPTTFTVVQAIYEEPCGKIALFPPNNMCIYIFLMLINSY